MVCIVWEYIEMDAWQVFIFDIFFLLFEWLLLSPLGSVSAGVDRQSLRNL